MKKNILLLITAIVSMVAGVFVGIALFNDTPTQQCYPAEEIRTFLKQFNDNIPFQKERTIFPLKYTTWHDAQNPDIETYFIEKQNWRPISLYDNAGSFVTIQNPLVKNLASKNPYDSIPDLCRYKVTVEGIHHGQMMTLHFLLNEKVWYLEQFEDYTY